VVLPIHNIDERIPVESDTEIIRFYIQRFRNTAGIRRREG